MDVASVVFFICGSLLVLRAHAASVCPAVPPGMLNAVNKISRNAHRDKSQRATYNLRNTPTHVFHNSTNVVRAVL